MDERASVASRNGRSASRRGFRESDGELRRSTEYCELTGLGDVTGEEIMKIHSVSQSGEKREEGGGP